MDDSLLVEASQDSSGPSRGRATFALRVLLASCATFLAACGGPMTTTVATVAVAPVCTILGVHFLSNSQLDTAIVSEETEPTGSHFGSFRTISPNLGFATDIYGISEAWLQTPSGPVLVRAQAHQAPRNLQASSWSIRAQDVNTGTWSPMFATGTANPGNQADDPQAGALTTPQLMMVGSTYNRTVFACAGARSEDNAVRTTSLFQINLPDFRASPPTGGGRVFIQDLLNGDGRFVPNARGGPLVGPANPPTPTITNPGPPVQEGSVQCAMTQNGDDVATRELHMLAISNGVLYHALASNWSDATSGSGSFTFKRFNTVSPWGDVGQVLGGGFGTIVAAAVTNWNQTAISVFFVAESGGRYRLFHTIRFSNGTWRPADDVLMMNGGSLNGLSIPYKVAAGNCPVFGQPQASEVVYVIWEEDRVTLVGRVPTSTAPAYTAMSQIFPDGNNDPARAPNTIQLGVSVRPIRQSPP